MSQSIWIKKTIKTETGEVTLTVESTYADYTKLVDAVNGVKPFLDEGLVALGQDTKPIPPVPEEAFTPTPEHVERKEEAAVAEIVCEQPPPPTTNDLRKRILDHAFRGKDKAIQLRDAYKKLDPKSTEAKTLQNQITNEIIVPFVSVVLGYSMSQWKELTDTQLEDLINILEGAKR